MIGYKTLLHLENIDCLCPTYHTDKQAASSNPDFSAIKNRFNRNACFFRNLQMKSLIVSGNLPGHCLVLELLKYSKIKNIV